MTFDDHQSSPTVLVALDGSKASSTAVPVARAVARQLGANLELLYVVGPHEVAPVPAELMRSFWGPSIHIEVRVVHGDPATAILQVIEDPQITLVVLTTHGREIEPGRRLGHVAETVIAQSIQPVLLVRPEAVDQIRDTGAELRHLLLPLDGSRITSAALVPAISLAHQLGAAIDLLYVANHGKSSAVSEAGGIGAPRYLDQPQHEWPAWSTEVMAHLRDCCGELPDDLVAQVFLTAGDIGDEIARFATEHHEDAVVLVRRSRLEPGRGRTLRSVLDKTPCPILLLGKHAEMTAEINERTS